MRAYLAIKFYEDCRNRKIIEGISEALGKAGFTTFSVIRDYEKWCKVKFKSEELMKLTFRAIDNSDIVVIDFSEKGVGLGIEAGYAFSKNIPIFVIAKNGSDISNTIKGISKEIIFYNKPEELIQKFKEIKDFI